MIPIDYKAIVKYAWMAYDSSRIIKRITDISAKVSTNHVYKITFRNSSFVVAKLSYFGKYEHFVEDHTIINVLSNNLPYPFDNFLSSALMKGKALFVHRFQNGQVDVWVVFYRPVKIKSRLPRRLNEVQIEKLAVQFANFHKACAVIRHTLPNSTKTLAYDIQHLQQYLRTKAGKMEYGKHVSVLEKQSDLFLQNMEALKIESQVIKIPVFIDWNIGNFSVTPTFKFFSRWDYDWFRMSSRMLDFYFISRVVSHIGDKTVFSYNIDPFMEERFILFLKRYHEIYPLLPVELAFLKEAYRFFILNYVIKEGRYFFNEKYVIKLQQEAFEYYFKLVDKVFNVEKLWKALKM